MAKRAIIFHGTGGNPEAVWYQWLGNRLNDRGYAVEIPHWPLLNKESINTFLPKVMDAHRFDSESVLVGHSGGAALLLAILEELSAPVRATIMVAGYWSQPNDEEEPVLRPRYDWNTIRANSGEMIIVNSVTDPYGCDSTQGRYIFDRTGGTQVIMNEGHFGDWNQEYASFPLLDRLIP